MPAKRSVLPRGGGVHLSKRRLESSKRELKGQENKELSDVMGIRAWEALDPYTSQDREDFRLAMSNVYVRRVCKIQTNLVVGQGYTTEIVPRREEEIPEEQKDTFEKTPVYVPYFDKELTPEQIKDRIDQMMIEMDLTTNLANAYITSLEQGRCVLAMTPLLRNEENGEFKLPEQFRIIRQEHTLRPVVDQNTGELQGVRLIGIESDQRDNILDIERAVYIMQGYNNELFSDFYGESKIANVVDIASNLNIVLNEDYEQASLHSWFTPPIFAVPVPPQEYGNEEGVINTFLNGVSRSKGQITAVTTSSKMDEKGVELLNNSTNSGDIAGLDNIRLGLIKAIIAHFGIPGFMISEGDVGQLGGNTNISELDNYLQTEIAPERKYMESVVSKQVYDRILSLLWRTEDISTVPLKLMHKINKPKLITIIPKDLYETYIDMLERGLIEVDGFRELTGMAEFSADTMGKRGADPTPGNNTASNWSKPWSKPVQVDVWPEGKPTWKTAIGGDKWT